MKDQFSDSLGLPEEEVMSTDQGLVENHHYRDLRGYDWSDFDRMRTEEQALLAYEGDLGEDEAHDVFGEGDNEVYMLDLDPGTATTVIALAAIGAVPVTSCNGGATEGHHYETHPLVLCWAEREHLDLILQAASKVPGIQVEPMRPGILIFTEAVDVAPMMTFADRLREIAQG